ncbi:hypothetical protein HQ545_08555 [Candidatus Woesearchaeota archaeon]|nr:hypothetical protein [Candidatus Woesearchaeota archaeon]
MHTLKKKRGRNIEVHHFSHIIEEDGTKHPVYLGKCPNKANKRLANLKSVRIKSENTLIHESDALQNSLGSITNNYTSYDSATYNIMKSYHKKRHFDRIVEKSIKTESKILPLIVIIAAIASIGALSLNNSITGFVVYESSDILTSKPIAFALGIIVVIAILGFVFHAADFSHRHRHDKYRPKF